MTITRPNIVLIVADDLDAASFSAMPELSALAQSRGLTFTSAYTTTPLCCPARASILRGQYVHNHGVLHNNGDRGGFNVFHHEGREDSTVATWLHDAGYRTALVGKYLNGYPRPRGRLRDNPIPPNYVPPGWDEWYAQVERGALGGRAFKLNENGQIVTYDDQPEHHSTDVFARHATRFVRDAAGSGQPFFLYCAPLAPHYPADPAPRHAARFPDAHAPRTPAFDEVDVQRKPRHLREASRFSAEQADAIDEVYRNRLRALQSLDELVSALVHDLEESGALENTYVVFTADHGWHLGEHRIPFGKETPYEESIRIPLVVLGPGILRGTVANSFALNIDLAPTIAELAGVPVPDFVDGRSLVPLLNGAEPVTWRTSFLVEHNPIGKTRAYAGLGAMPRTPAHQALRLRTGEADLLFVRYDTDEQEVYDLTHDPHQLQNTATDADPALVRRWNAQLDDFQRCHGTTCRALDQDSSLG